MKKIKEFFKKLFKKRNTLNLPKIDNTKINSEERANIRKELKIKSNTKLIEIQKEYENGTLKDNDCLYRYIKDLIDLYENQIKELDYQIALKK